MSENRRKTPFLSGLLSFFFPGAGQLYNEDFSKGIILFVATIASIGYIVYSGLALGNIVMNGQIIPEPVLIVRIVITALFLFGIWLYGIIDAVIYAQRIANSTVAAAPAPEKSKEGAIALGVVLVIIGIIAALVQFGLNFEYIIKYGGPLALIVLGCYLIAKTGGFIKGGN